MYAEADGGRKTLGDVDIVYHDGLYHLFHLVLPNHDFVAHAVSNNGFSWRRVENALFIGHPGSWDDSMLWTVHVSPDPSKPGSWRMFYTGLSRRDHGLIQRIGLATSDDLYHWSKYPVNWQDRRTALPYALPGRPPQPSFDYDEQSCFPLEPHPEFYESSPEEGRAWISWRDPYYFSEGGQGWLLAAGRVNSGPVVRRGCVAVMKEVAPNQFEHQEPLFHPALYDDIEVPNLVVVEGEYYLIGSLREDAKVRYWHCPKLGKPWRSFSDNVLLASGNYAGRICQDKHGLLLFSFFTPGGLDRVTHNVMPPPKRLVRDPHGQLIVKSFEGFDQLASKLEHEPELLSLDGSTEWCEVHSHQDGWQLRSLSGFRAAVFEQQASCFRMRASLEIQDEGKCGLLFRLDPETRDGYYLSLDLFKGVAQLRAWGSGPNGSGEHMMRFESLQSGYWRVHQRGTADIRLLVYGSYLELSVAGQVILSLADHSFSEGAFGFYAESTELSIKHVAVEMLERPAQTDWQLANG